MPKEIERKFLIDINKISLPEKFENIKQGYIETVNKITVRLRTSDNLGYLTIKSPRIGISRAEYEYEIPLSDATEMLNSLCQKPLIEKNRYKIKIENHYWEIDVFLGENQGLYLAEVELSSEDDMFEIPEWVLSEVSMDSKYNNAYLTLNPFKKW